MYLVLHNIQQCQNMFVTASLQANSNIIFQVKSLLEPIRAHEVVRFLDNMKSSV